MAAQMEKPEKRLKRTAMWISKTCQLKCFPKFIFVVCKVWHNVWETYLFDTKHWFCRSQVILSSSVPDSREAAPLIRVWSTLAIALSSVMIKQADPPSVYNQEEKSKHAEIIFAMLPSKSEALVIDLVGRFILLSLAVCQLWRVTTGFKVVI